MLSEVEEFLPRKLSAALRKAGKSLDGLKEIRIASSAPAALVFPDGVKYIDVAGRFVTREKAVSIYPGEMPEIFAAVCKNSVYSYEDQIRSGYITTETGVRVGLCGTAVVTDENVTGMKNITSLVFRIGREVTGCAEEMFGYIFDGVRIVNTVIVSAPGCGKTTVLRDISRCFSQKGVRACVVDERNEIAAMSGGVARFNVGFLTDVLTGFSKADGIIRAIRTLSPQVVLCDELATVDEAEQLLYAMNSGCGFVITAHAGSVKEAESRECIRKLTENGAIKQIIFIGKSFIRDHRVFDVKTLDLAERMDENEDYCDVNSLRSVFADGTL